MTQTSSDGGATFSDPHPIFGGFNINRALHQSSNRYFLGDYQSLAVDATRFHPFFVAAGGGNSRNPVDVYTSTVQP